jgi:hypothetical protein
MWVDRVSLGDDPILPRNCLVGFGIPTSKDAFESAQCDPNRDFAGRFLGGWEQYLDQLIEDIRAFEAAVGPKGVTLVTNLNLRDCGSLFAKGDLRVFILFSHWKDNCVEFHDGLAPFSSFIKEVPWDFAGILDLCVCHPIALVDELEQSRPHCLVRYIPREAKPVYWLSYYKALFSLLQSGARTYPQAMEDLTIGLLNSTKRKGRG